MDRFKNWKKPLFDNEGYACECLIYNRLKKAHIFKPCEYKNEYYPGCRYGWRCFYPENLKLGYKCDIGAFTLIQAKYGVDIEENVEIGPHSYICSWSTEDNKMGKIKIGSNTKIGAFSTVMPGISIGKNSIIGAYSFVNKDIPDSVTAYGIPCKIMNKTNKNEYKISLH